jgi:DNA polymerase-3 subunit alpha
MPKSFVHLHLHTEYSMLDGASRIGDVVGAAVADGQPAVGITDHGNMYGVLELYAAARDAGVTPVLGMEGYFTDGSRFDRPKRSEHEIYHLTLLAETNAGYHNLIQLSSAAFIDGYYYKPRTDWELFERYHEGLVATTGCLGGLVPQLIRDDRYDEALKAAARFQDIFGKDHFFVEVQDHGLADDERVSKPLLDIARAARRCSRRTTVTTRSRTRPKRTTPCCACRPVRW